MTNLDVLIVDDEPTNVDPIMHFLNRAGVAHTYATTIPEAVEALTERIERKDVPYGAIILDNHFQDHELSRYGTEFDGIDFAIILAGKERLFSNQHKSFIKECLEPSYLKLVRLYGERIVMFSGSVNSDSRREPERYSGFQLVPKCPSRTDRVCEEKLVRALEELGYEFDIPMDSIGRYKWKNGLEYGVNHFDSDRFKGLFDDYE